MGVTLACAYLVGVLYGWRHTLTWDDWADRATFDAWNLVFSLLWPLTLLGLAAGIAWDVVTKPLNREQALTGRRRSRQHGRLVTWAN